MSSANQNKHIARLLAGAMSIDGTMSKDEQKKVAKSLMEMGMSELIADVGAAIENDTGDFDMFQECRDLIESLGSEAESLSPIIFRMIADVVAHDRFVSVEEATYLASLARRFSLSSDTAQEIFKQVMAANRSRLQLAGTQIDEILNPALKELLSFDGADDLVGELPEDSLEELLHKAQETLDSTCSITQEDLDRSLTVLGLGRTASLDDAEEVWKDTINRLDLPKLATLGETYVTAAISRISRIHDAYKTILHFHEFIQAKDQANYEAEQLEKKIERASTHSPRDELAPSLEDQMTGVGTGLVPDEESST